VNVWVVKTSEMLASDSDNGRLLRSGIVANMLDDRGHRVTWWMSTFDHANRRNRATTDLTVAFGAHGTIRMLYSPGYRASISFARLRDHTLWGRAFGDALASAEPPDVILCSYPTIEAAAVCVRYGAQHGVPVVLDLRDMWPDIFGEFAPALLRPLAQALLWPWRTRARAALRGATALFGITDEFLEWGLQLAGRSRSSSDGAFLLAYPDPLPASESDPTARSAESFWDARNVTAADAFNVVLIGSMTKRRFEMPTVLAAARELQHDARQVKFILAGDGDDLQEYRREGADCANVDFPGWLSAAQIRALLGRAHLGLVPYRNTPDLVMSVPNKVGEYFAAGVPVATCLRGTLARLLAQRHCGMQFAPRLPQTLVALVRRLRDDAELCRELSANARLAYREELSGTQVYGRMIARLEAIAAAGVDRSIGSAGGLGLHT
jgi:glycosyltransferase involved in cell wall biosynthesis